MIMINDRPKTDCSYYKRKFKIKINVSLLEKIVYIIHPL